MSAHVDYFPSARPSPIAGRVGIRDFTFEACSGFTQVTARPVAQPPKAAFVTRLRSGQLPSQTARQLPDLSTIIWVDSSSTGYPCLSGAHQLSGDKLPSLGTAHDGRICALRSDPLGSTVCIAANTDGPLF